MQIILLSYQRLISYFLSVQFNLLAIDLKNNWIINAHSFAVFGKPESATDLLLPIESRLEKYFRHRDSNPGLLNS